MHWKYRTYKLVKDMRIVLKLTKLWLLWFSGLIGWHVGWTPGSATCFVGPTPNKVSPSTLHCYFFSPFCNNTDLLICKLCKLRGNIFGETVGWFFCKLLFSRMVVQQAFDYCKSCFRFISSSASKNLLLTENSFTDLRTYIVRISKKGDNVF